MTFTISASMVFGAIAIIGVAIMLIAAIFVSTDGDPGSAAYQDSVFKLVRWIIVGLSIFMVGMMGLCYFQKIERDKKQIERDKKQSVAYNRFIRETGADSGNAVYYNGQAVSGASLIINKDNLDDYLIEYDKTNKVVKIMSRK